MFYTLSQLKDFFDKLKLKIKKKEGLVYIFCSYETDSIVSAKMLSVSL